MVERAEEQSVVDVRLATEKPRDDVSDFAPAGRRGAAGRGAPAVADRDRPALSPGEEAFATAQVEPLARPSEYDRDDFGVTGESPGRRRADRRVDSVDAGAADAGEERLVI